MIASGVRRSRIENLADKTRSDSMSDNRKAVAKSFDSAEAQYLKDVADADNTYWLAYHEANRVYGVAVAGATDPAVIAAAAAVRTNSYNTAVNNKTAALDTAGVTRRTTEGEALKTKTVSDAQAQATWVSSAGSAFSGWVSDVGTDVNEFATAMKTHGVGYTTTTADSAADANETVADETHNFNDGSAETCATSNILPWTWCRISSIHESNRTSDRGSQYASDAFRGLLESNAIRPSMSRKGNCYDNAPMESFFGRFKTEYVYWQDFTSIEDVARSVGKYIGEFYNVTRRHSSLGYVSPVEYESKKLYESQE